MLSAKLNWHFRIHGVVCVHFTSKWILAIPRDASSLNIEPKTITPGEITKGEEFCRQPQPIWFLARNVELPGLKEIRAYEPFWVITSALYGWTGLKWDLSVLPMIEAQGLILAQWHPRRSNLREAVLNLTCLGMLQGESKPWIFRMVNVSNPSWFFQTPAGLDCLGIKPRNFF